MYYKQKKRIHPLNLVIIAIVFVLISLLGCASPSLAAVESCEITSLTNVDTRLSFQLSNYQPERYQYKVIGTYTVQEESGSELTKILHESYHSKGNLYEFFIDLDENHPSVFTLTVEVSDQTGRVEKADHVYNVKDRKFIKNDPQNDTLNAAPRLSSGAGSDRPLRDHFSR